ncbi:MAG: hypothetical protein IPF54_22375 [Draconibacterium sp.]|nr:hypothetical protein [Draconibacterium sp.]
MKQHPEVHLIEGFQNQLLTHENRLNTQIDKIAEDITSSGFEDSYFEDLKSYTSLINESGFGYLVYQSGKLVYWSDRSVSFYETLREFKKREGLLLLPNGFYLSSGKTVGNMILWVCI